jgi:amino acid transporter
MAKESASPNLRAELGAFDFTLLVIGAVIGADVYIVASMGAAFLGPAQLVAWLVAGVLAAVIALAFVQCAAILPRVGGSYAYARAAFGPFVGFVAGWALYVGEWVALPVFPLAFVNYLAFFLPHLSGASVTLIKVALFGLVTAVNIFGVRAGGKSNDVLTIAKLFPLAVLICGGIAFALFRPNLAGQHLTPFAPLGWGGLGSAVLLIFWAYAGFELAVLPASEVRDARRTLPRGLIQGMAIATLFYLLTSFAVVVAVPWQVAAASTRPLADAFGSILAGFGITTTAGAAFMSIGAIISILGVFDVFMLSVARLGYAMAIDGLFPPALGQIHPRFGTPWLGLLFQAGSGLLVALFFDLTNLIAISVFFLGICYLFTALSALRLVRRAPEARLHLPALELILALAGLSGVYLSLQAPVQLIVLGTAVMAVGLGVYVWRRHAWREAAELRGVLAQDEQRFLHWARQRERWLLRFFRRHARTRS